MVEKLMSRERIFSREQREEHAGRVGKQCEAEIGHFQRCPATIYEADHIEAFGKGGKTDEENMLFLCTVDHYIKHWLDGDMGAANLIKARMCRDDLNELHRRGY